jgi:hypothetical protein
MVRQVIMSDEGKSTIRKEYQIIVKRNILEEGMSYILYMKNNMLR